MTTTTSNINSTAPELTAEHIETVVDTYLAAWNETDDEARAALIERVLGADLWYRDSVLEADGRDSFCAALGGVQQAYPDHVMSRTSVIDTHHDLVRFNWAVGVPGAQPTFVGVDVAKFDGDGRLNRIIGFFGTTATPL